LHPVLMRATLLTDEQTTVPREDHRFLAPDCAVSSGVRRTILLEPVERNTAVTTVAAFTAISDARLRF
jgi:mannose-1-phosphate guanylyltransferase